MGWLSSFDRKKHQRRVNQYVRAINKNIENDNLWRGRFYVHQEGTPWFHIYEDKSGASLEYVCLVITDRLTEKSTKKWDSVNGWCHFGGYRLWSFVNDAIVNIFDVWHSELDPYKIKNDPKYDFRKK